MIVIESMEKEEYLPPDGKRHISLLFSLSIDNHSILDGKYFGDYDWICKLKSKIEYYFPHLVNLSAAEIDVHHDKFILGTYLKHQRNHFQLYLLGAPECKSFFDDSYNPCHHFNYFIPASSEL